MVGAIFVNKPVNNFRGFMPLRFDDGTDSRLLPRSQNKKGGAATPPRRRIENYFTSVRQNLSVRSSPCSMLVTPLKKLKNGFG